VRCAPVTPVRGALTAVISLTEFSESLKAGDYHAVYVTEAMTEADKDYVYAGMKNCRTAALARTDTQMMHVYTYTSSPLTPMLLAYVPRSLSLPSSSERIEEEFLVVKGEWLPQHLQNTAGGAVPQHKRAGAHYQGDSFAPAARRASER
jgi:hypothetical protein